VVVRMILRKESLEVVRQSEVPFVIPRELADRRRFPVLWAVDPHGDAIFNSRQMRAMFDEIDLLLDEVLDAEERNSLVEARKLCEEGVRRHHRYLWFVGD
jgi:hypothetical protein